MVNRQKKEAPKYTPALSLGVNMAAGMGIFTFIGFKIDEKRGGGTAWTMAGIFCGLLYCGYEVWKIIRDMNQ